MNTSVRAYFRLPAFCVLPVVLLIPAPAGPLTFNVTGPPSLARSAGDVRGVDTAAIARALASAGLQAPDLVDVTLVPEDDPLAAAVPRWIVALASGGDRITMFPSRIGSYPHDSIQAVVTHEVAHLALTHAAGGQPLPRWFHEGVAVSVESGWGVLSDARLMLASFSRPGLDDLARLFAADTRSESAEAYLLAAAVVANVRERHGADVPGRVAAQVGRGVRFARAFEIETGETPEDAAARAWVSYRRWTAWLPIVTGGAALWSGILVLAFVAFLVRLRRRARRRRQWDDEDLDRSRYD